MKIWRCFLFSVAVLLPLSNAQAQTGGMMFGTAEDIHKLQDVGLKGPGGERLVLAYKTTTKYFIGGVFVRDDGYVLSADGDGERYFQLPTGDRLSSLQEQGLLPNPLPRYGLSAFDYGNGYSLWMIVAITVLAVAIPVVVRNRRRVRAA